MKMPKFKENRMTLMYAHNAGIIDDEELFLLPEYFKQPRSTLHEFSLDHMSDDECPGSHRWITCQMMSAKQSSGSSVGTSMI